MKPEEAAVLVAVVAESWPQAREMTDGMADAWVAAFEGSDMPFEACRQAVVRLLRSSHWRPQPADVLELAAVVVRSSRPVLPAGPVPDPTEDVGRSFSEWMAHERQVVEAAGVKVEGVTAILAAAGRIRRERGWAVGEEDLEALRAAATRPPSGSARTGKAATRKPAARAGRRSSAGGGSAASFKRASASGASPPRIEDPPSGTPSST